MTTMIAPTARLSRRQAPTAVSSSDRRATQHLHGALLAEARRRTEQLSQPAPAPDDDLGQALMAAAQRTLVDVGEALNRWVEGSYGLCLKCKSEIPAARLELRPWAPHCVACYRR